MKLHAEGVLIYCRKDTSLRDPFCQETRQFRPGPGQPFSETVFCLGKKWALSRAKILVPKRASYIVAAELFDCLGEYMGELLSVEEMA